MMVCTISGEVRGVEEAMSWKRVAKTRPAQRANKSDPHRFSRRDGRLDTSVRCQNVHRSERRGQVEKIIHTLCYGPVRLQAIIDRCLTQARKNRRLNKRVKTKRVFLHQLRDNDLPLLHRFTTTSFVASVLRLYERLGDGPPFPYFVLAALYLMRTPVDSLDHYPELEVMLPETNRLHKYQLEEPINKKSFTDAKTWVLKRLRTINKKKRAKK